LEESLGLGRSPPLPLKLSLGDKKLQVECQNFMYSNLCMTFCYLQWKFDCYGDVIIFSSDKENEPSHLTSLSLPLYMVLDSPPGLYSGLKAWFTTLHRDFDLPCDRIKDKFIGIHYNLGVSQCDQNIRQHRTGTVSQTAQGKTWITAQFHSVDEMHTNLLWMPNYISKNPRLAFLDSFYLLIQEHSTSKLTLLPEILQYQNVVHSLHQ
ncbi:hypothetical protein STEG23_028671, partial [Scotinomys teguina]